ncbi:response regulator [Sediminivirga luteola]|uniref:DNA-binding response regulator n=1 Tax=Sediminivirga luteola TaxID=1774748 RepID=A0A8J2TWG0_9MICO|nr:response regulator transcription factor [Sediminivirga luteola]MCI2266564.1 response regulator transcription factor [Sediminivirga luteola]GGA07909.1 DNA-binding response regulator [Sediminivirga luteola]
MSIRVALVDDQELIRTGFRMVLESQPDIEVVAEADDGDTALAMLAGTAVDVIVMDVRMPRMDGVEATRRIRAAAEGPETSPAPQVLILTTFDLDEYAYQALRAGAAGFMLKDAGVEEITQAIRHVHAGDAVVAPSTTRRLLEHFTALPGVASGAPGDRRDDAGTEALAGLTAREREVLGLIAGGMSNAEIAGRLGLAEGTVKIHVGSVLRKLGLRDRVQAVVFAYESGLVTPREPPR